MSPFAGFAALEMLGNTQLVSLYILIFVRNVRYMYIHVYIYIVELP